MGSSKIESWVGVKSDSPRKETYCLLTRCVLLKGATLPKLLPFGASRYVSASEQVPWPLGRSPNPYSVTFAEVKTLICKTV